MRKTFGLVVASGIVLAATWSWIRRASEADDPARAPEVVHADPAPATDAPKPVVDAAAHPATPAPGDPVAAAKEILASLPGAMGDAATRARASATAADLMRTADAAPTREGVEQRMLARRLVAAIYDCDSATREERAAAYERSRTLFDVLVRGNGAPPETALRHKVAAGESVWALAKGPWRAAGASVAPGFVLWVNGVSDARRLRVGQVLKVPLEPITVLVRKRSFELTVSLGGAPIERFAVAVGADAKTPVGVFQVKDCLKNPDWYMNGKRIPFGSPGHIIGTRWIGLSGAPEADGIGIHGTNDESSIGTPASLGCVRMRNADVERIFEWISAGTRVEIRD
jgi:hypothetical protein